MSFVYFVQASSGPIKIGVAADPELRLKALQNGSWEELKLLGVCGPIPGRGLALEKRLHAEFGNQRLLGEWFSPSPELLARISQLVEPADVVNGTLFDWPKQAVGGS